LHGTGKLLAGVATIKPAIKTQPFPAAAEKGRKVQYKIKRAGYP
jgi:hypothetical protein